MSTKTKLTTSYRHAPRKLPYLGVTVGQQLYVIADKYPDKEMYVFYAENERITFGQMKKKSQQFAASLLTIGIKKGDRIAIWGANHSEWLITLFACTQLGITVVQLRLEFPLSTNQTILNEMGCKLLLLTRSPADLLNKACEIIPTLISDEKSHLNCDSLPDLKCVIICNQTSQGSGAYSMSDFLQIGSEIERKRIEDICWTVDIDDPCLVYFTSGTTGIPKATLHNHHGLLNSVYAAASCRCDVEEFDYKWESTRFATTMTFAGAACCMSTFVPVVWGCTTVVLYPTFEKEMMANALQHEKVTDGVFFIHHISDLVNLPNIDAFDFSHLRTVCLSGSVIPAKLRHRVQRMTKYIMMGYGMSEALGTHFNHPLDPPHILENAAVCPVGGIEVKIVDDNNKTVSVNTMGEIHIRGFSVFMYYCGNEKLTQQTRDANGWLLTGDLGKMDEDGFVNLLGRKKDIIIKEAVNLSPVQLESVLYQHPQIIGAMVAGVPDKRTGEEVCACIKVEQGSPVSEEDIKQFCKDKVNTLLVPKYVLFVNEFPITETGKYSRKRLTEIATKRLNLT